MEGEILFLKEFRVVDDWNSEFVLGQFEHIAEGADIKIGTTRERSHRSWAR